MITLKKDTHIHTRYSPDADQNASFESYIKQAKKLGLEEIIFTDHVDFDAAHPLFKTPINYNEYIKEFNQVTKNETSLSIKLGVEIGYQPHVKENINEFLNNYPFEHIILSIHYLDKQDLYTKEFFKGKTKKDAYTRYFEILLEAIQEINNFTVIGHLDYISRYSDFGDYDYNEYKDIIDRILKELIHKNKGIEINTSGFDYEGRMYPKQEVVNRFLELGGSLITVGSDCHSIFELNRYYNRITPLVRSMEKE